MKWALDWSKISMETATSNFKKHMRHYFEFPKFCEELCQAIVGKGFYPIRDLKRDFRRHQRQGFELQRALDYLEEEERIRGTTKRIGKAGAETKGFEPIIEEIVEDADEKTGTDD